MSLRAEPLERGAGVVCVEAISGGAVPKAYLEAFRKGLLEALNSGTHGFPITDLRITFLDGATHKEDSSEFAFHAAGVLAVRHLLEHCQSRLLEPLMSVGITTPERFVGDVIGHLNARRGKIAGLDMRGSSALVQATAPLEQLFGYANALRSMTQGRASFSMRLSGYDLAPTGQGSA